MLKKRFSRLAARIVSKRGIARLAARLGLFKPQVITRLDGGLASQMWQFSLGYTVARKLGMPLKIDTSWFCVDGRDSNGVRNRHFLLWDTFPVLKERYAASERPNYKDDSLFKLAYTDINSDRPFYEYREHEFFAPRPHYIDQYHAGYAHVRHYKDELVELFRFGLSLSAEESAFLQLIQNTESCALHLRRGDFVGSSFDVCTEYYYLESIRRIRELCPGVQFYVFSNDELYAESIVEKADGKADMHIFRGRNEDDPRVDMYFISECRHAIISNSAFSAFPTWLSYKPGNIVIRPEYWRLGDLKEPMQDVYMEAGWIKVPLSENETE